MSNDKWYALLNETQFAVHQAATGVASLATAVHADQLLFSDDTNVVRYTLHNGLFAYSTGLERLAKLSYAAAHFRVHHRFPTLRGFGHGISDLLATVAEIDVSGFGGSRHPNDVIERGIPVPVGSPFVELLDDYARGAGRYEFLDSLATGTTPDLYERWAKLAAGATPSARLRSLCRLPESIEDALYRGSRLLEETANIASFDLLIEPYIDKGLPRFSARSAEVALRYYDLVQWVAAYLSALSTQIFYYDRRGEHLEFPLLSEVIDGHLMLGREAFMEFHILKLNDYYATVEAIEEMNPQAE